VLSRPTAGEVADYRRRVDERIERLVRDADDATLSRILPVLELGVAHEEQHQELLLTDILHAFAQNPLRPAFLPRAPASSTAAEPGPISFVPFDGGLTEIGAPAGAGFVFDNERPRHRRWIDPFAIADRLVTVREVKAFIEDGGYENPTIWLSEGFDFVRANRMSAPLYVRYEGGSIEAFTLAGSRTPSDHEPATHLSYYEADAIARFLGARLPTEAEWELVAAAEPVQGNFAEDGVLGAVASPRGEGNERSVRQIFGDAWEWTSSAYEPYPGYQAPPGALGEYNGKFMVSQLVLRGGSCLTPRRHVRASYRNFWHPHTRFQMTGLRLARGIS
jgi:ergothioneine biosynthesis protein EgtB